MPADEIRMEDIGTKFKITVKDGSSVVDISGATTKQLIFKKPGGTKLTKTAVFFTDGTDGIITYDTLSGDLDEDGMWKVQGYVVLSSGTYHTDIHRFKVHRNL